jgi:hypothetical protein
MAYQLAVRYHTLAAPPAAPAGGGALAVRVSYDRTELDVGHSARVRAVVTNRGQTEARMLLVDLGTPPGFAVDPRALDGLREKGVIQRYTVTGRGVIVYLAKLDAAQSVTLEYDITARMPLKAVARPSVVYAYYNPESRATAAGEVFTVR